MPGLDTAAELYEGSALLRSALILAAALVAAWLADQVLTAGLGRWARRTATDLDERAIEILHTPVRTSVVLIGLTLVTYELEGTVAAAAGPAFARITLGVLATVAVLLWVVAAIRLSDLLLEGASRRLRVVQPRTLPLFSNVGRVILVGAAAYFLLLSWNVDITAWVASAGIIGIAVGFAAKDTLANLFAGIFILADAPYKVGDFINLDGGERGQVTHVGIRSTRLLTRDDVEITLPNSIIANSKIVNETGGRWDRTRVRVKVGVAYGSDVDRVRLALLEVAAEAEQVSPDPAPRVRFRGFGDSGLDFELLCWIDEPVLRGRVLDALNTAVYKRFAEEGIEIPYPKRDVYLHWQAPAPPEAAPDEPGSGPGAEG